jgi:multiple sugar transport system permease protein
VVDRLYANRSRAVSVREAADQRQQARVAVPRRRRRRSWRDVGAAWLLVLPALGFVIAFVLFPLGFAIYISLTNWPLVGPYHYIGADNYRALGHDPVFRHSVYFTCLYTAIVTGPIFVVGYALAALVRANRFGSAFFRTIFFLPFVVGLATESFMLVLELRPDTGAVNFLLDRAGITNGKTAWLVDSNLALGAICVLVTWYAAGLTMIILMAGMQGIPRDLYESAAVDGASWWRRERSITLPLLRRPIALSLIISVTGSLLAFNQFYILTQGGPGTSTDTVVMWIYQTAFVRLHLGAATAMAIVLVVAVGLITAAQFFFLREETEQ